MSEQSNQIDLIKLYSDISEYQDKRDYEGVRTFLINTRSWVIKEWKKMTYTQGKDPRPFLIEVFSTFIDFSNQEKNDRMMNGLLEDIIRAMGITSGELRVVTNTDTKTWRSYFTTKSGVVWFIILSSAAFTYFLHSK